MTTEPATDQLIAEIERRVTKYEPVGLTGQIQALISRIRKEQEDKAVMARALTALVDEYCDYAIVNKLGDPEKQHNIKNARAALTGSSTIISDMEAEIAVLRARLKDTEAALFEVSEENDAFKAEAGR